MIPNLKPQTLNIKRFCQPQTSNLKQRTHERTTERLKREAMERPSEMILQVRTLTKAIPSPQTGKTFALYAPNNFLF